MMASKTESKKNQMGSKVSTRQDHKASLDKIPFHKFSQSELQLLIEYYKILGIDTSLNKIVIRQGFIPKS